MMTATDTDLQAQLAALLARKCQAIDLPSASCGRPSSGYYRTTCQPDGHVRDFYLCTRHAEAGDGRCFTCWKQDGHICRLDVVTLTMGADGWTPHRG